VSVAVISDAPRPTAETSPVLLTLTTSGALLEYDTAPALGIGAPHWS
jgi:hypothetical protein